MPVTYVRFKAGHHILTCNATSSTFRALVPLTASHSHQEQMASTRSGSNRALTADHLSDPALSLVLRRSTCPHSPRHTHRVNPAYNVILSELLRRSTCPHGLRPTHRVNPAFNVINGDPISHLRQRQTASAKYQSSSAQSLATGGRSSGD